MVLLSWATALRSRYERGQRSADRHRRCHAARLACPVRRIGRGEYVTQDGRVQFLYHDTHGAWFISYGYGVDWTPDPSHRWFDTLWEAQEALIAERTG